MNKKIRIKCKDKKVWIKKVLIKKVWVKKVWVKIYG
jgi:hypothetical protein